MINQEKIKLLVLRWEHMAQTRETMALSRREAGEITAAIGHSSAADGYRRCAAELLTFISGKTPPPVGERWEEAEKKESGK